jgi:inner membrane protein
MWATLFIIDPMVLLPVWIGAIAAWCWREQPPARTWAAAGLSVCIAYVGWSIVAKQLVERAVDSSLVDTPHANAPHFTVPTPFNTLLWRVVVMTPDGYLEGYRSLVADRGPIRFHAYRSDHAALDAASKFPEAERLRWFASGFVKAQVSDDEIVISDLRMGSEPDYFFSYAVARRGADGWQPIAPRYMSSGPRGGMTLRVLWWRIWQEPVVDREASR